VTSLLRNGAQKLLGILITIGEAVAYVLSGMYGSVSQLGTGNAILIILQLFFAGIIVDVWTNFFRKVMVWDLAFLCSLLPISGKHVGFISFVDVLFCYTLAYNKIAVM
jgi:hypothetical protein